MYSKYRKIEEVVRKELDRLFRFVFLRIGNRSDAEDIVQEVLLKILGSNDGLGRVSDVRAYVYKSLYNACVGYHRASKGETMPLDDVDADSAEQPDAEISQEFVRIRSVLADLPEEQREILHLRCTDGLKFREIAEILSIPEPTAKSRYRYAIRNLQNRLNI